jgi:hypothetical protein
MMRAAGLSCVVLLLVGLQLRTDRESAPAPAVQAQRSSNLESANEAVHGFNSPGPVLPSGQRHTVLKTPGFSGSVDELSITRLYFCTKDYVPMPGKNMLRPRDVERWIAMRGIPSEKVLLAEGEGTDGTVAVKSTRALQDGVYCVHTGKLAHNEPPPGNAFTFTVGGIPNVSVLEKKVKTLDGAVELAVEIKNAGSGEFNFSRIILTLQRVNPGNARPTFVQRWDQPLPAVAAGESKIYESTFPTERWGAGTYYFYGHIDSVGNSGDNDNIAVIQTEPFQVTRPGN